jgi:hypothetical protein
MEPQEVQPTNPNPTGQPPNQPLFGGPFQQPVQPPPNVPVEVEPDNSSKNRIIIIIAVVSVIILAVAGLVIIAALSSDSTNKKSGTAKDQAITKLKGPEAATSESVQLVDDLISQDISSLNDDKDFPADKLSDRNLNL